ncbi:hypothetical protein EV426DRAFT_92349 [Tirmania nivea]|nr:hypothetical protein EV426DRAFT_92349 [Tirmania nivea]
MLPASQKERLPSSMAVPQRIARQDSRNPNAHTTQPAHPHNTHAQVQAQHMSEQGRTGSRRQQGQGQQGLQGGIDYGAQVARDRGGGERERERKGEREKEREREREVKYVVYLKLPFARGGFVDPPQVDWDSNKERALWRILSRTTRNQGIDWNHLAQQFQVSRAFLLQQAAWLYERELSQVRAQMRKGMGGAAAAPASNISTPSGTASNASPRPLSPAPMAMGMAGGTRMARTGSGGSSEPPKTLSQFSLRGPAAAALLQCTHTPVGTRPTGSVTPGRPMAQPMSRTPSTQTSRPTSQASFQPPARFANSISHQPQQQQPQYDFRDTATVPAAGRIYSSASSSGDGDDDDDSDSDDSIMVSSKRKGKRTDGGLFGEDEDAEEEEIYLPFSRAKIDSSVSMDEDELGTATLRGVKKKKSLGGGGGAPTETTKQDTGERARVNPKRLPSEASSTSTTRQGHGGTNAVAQRKLTASGGAESSPSMGSSFSDLSDASISQSAMEDAYLSNMRTVGVGSVASRISVLGLGLGR